ncbi:MAG: Holliday junction resolvase RecU [Thermoleophilia bacterium]
MNPLQKIAGYEAQKLGEAWQDDFETRCRALAQSGLLVVARTPEEMKKIRQVGNLWLCHTEGIGPSDFILLSRGLAIGAECKATKEETLSLSVVEPHQRAFLDSYDQQGGIGILAVLLGEDRYILPWRDVQALSTFRPSLTTIRMDSEDGWLELLRRRVTMSTKGS